MIAPSPSHTSEESPKDPVAGVAAIVQQNIRELIKARQKVERKKSRSERLADWFVRAAGSMWFAYLHAIWFTLWVGDSLVRGHEAFDPFPFSLLTTIVSLEAIFLTLFVLVSQNQQAVHDEQRMNLHLQIDLLAEHEITRVLCVVDRIAEKLGVEDACDSEASELEHDVTPADLLKELHKQERKAEAKTPTKGSK